MTSANGTINHCTVESSVTVSGTGDKVGGIAGESSGNIINNSSAATVTGNNFVGGVIGYVDGNTQKLWYCHNDGKVTGKKSVGGVAGYSAGGGADTIKYIYNTGSVTGDTDVAGLVGTAKSSYPKLAYNIGAAKYKNGNDAPQLMNYSDNINSHKLYLFYPKNTTPFGAAEGVSYSFELTYAESNKTAFTFTEDQVSSGELAWRMNLTREKENWHDNWTQNLSVTNGHPTIGDEAYSKYEVYPANSGYHNHLNKEKDCSECRGIAWEPYRDPSYSGNSYKITNYHELLGLADKVNKGESLTAALMNDIVFNENLLDASGNVQVTNPIKWTPIGNEDKAFSGSFAGNGHTISGLYVDDAEYAGLFGFTRNNTAKISSVGVVDSYFKGTECVGGIIGAYNVSDSTGNPFIVSCFTYNVTLEGEDGAKTDPFCNPIGTDAPQNYNSYCLADSEQTLPGSSCSTMTAKDFASGKVAYKLNKYFTDNSKGNVWGQVVKNTENEPVDPLPTTYRKIGNDGSNEVINYAEKYHNHLGSATCSICGTVNPQQPDEEPYDGGYQIGTPSELLWFANYVNTSSGGSIQDAVLTADIDMTGVKWTPIGTKTNPFHSDFDGRGHVINGLTVNDESLDYVGLFGCVTSGATVKNVGIAGKFSGKEYIGGIAGYNDNEKSISNCFFIGTVSGEKSGAISGNNKFTNSYYQSNDSEEFAKTEKQFKSGEVAELLNTLPDGKTQEVWGQFIGGENYPRALTATNKVIRDYTSLGWHNHLDGITANACDKCVHEPKQDENGVYQISTINELYWFADHVNKTDSSINAELVNDITVNKDINAQDLIVWASIGTEAKPFKGKFDGKGHIISGLVNETSTEAVGLFGKIDRGAEVSNVGVVNCRFNSPANAGGIAGENEGTITSSFIYNANGLPVVGKDNGAADHCHALTDADKSNLGEYTFDLDNGAKTWGCKLGTDEYPTAWTEANCVYSGYDGNTYHNHKADTLYCNDCRDFVSPEPTKNDDGFYEITAPSELVWFAKWVNGKIDGAAHPDSNAVVSASKKILSFAGFEEYNWTPIGTKDKPFSGKFDGNGHTITGLKCSGADYAGLFGYVDNAEISKLIVTGCSFSGTEAGVFCVYAGANGASIKYCGAYDNELNGTSKLGFIGNTFRSDASNVLVKSCYITDFSADNIDNVQDHSYYLGDTRTDITMTAEQFRNGELAYALNEGLTDDVWFQNIGTNQYPQFSGKKVYQTTPCVSYNNDGKTNKPHKIGTNGRCTVCGRFDKPNQNSEGQFELLTKSQLLFFAEAASTNSSVSAILMKDIDMTGAEWTPIGTKDNPFSGSFDGKGFTISGINFDTTDAGKYAGLFGCVKDGKISNLKITNSSFKSADVSGGICAVNNGGTIENCAVDNVVVNGITAGGICGTNSGTIKNCFVSSKVSSDGIFSGICGSNSGTINNSVSLFAGAAVGENTNGSITNCFYDSDVAGNQDFGDGVSTAKLTHQDILKELGNSWSKEINTQTALYYPELTAFKTGKYSVGVKDFKLTLENTDKDPVYKDTLHFTFDVLATPETGSDWTSVLAALVGTNKVQLRDFALVLDGKITKYGTASASGSRLGLTLNGETAGEIYVDSSLKVKAEISYPLTAAKEHTIAVKYVGRNFKFLTGKTAECKLTIAKAIPVITDPAASVEYGKSLKDADLTEGWKWADSSAVPTAENIKFTAVMTPEDTENYDYSGIDGFKDGKVTREVSVTLKKAVPEISVTTDPFSAMPGTKITVSVSAVNPNNEKFSDVPAVKLSYSVGGSETAVADGSFVIPDDLEEGTVITVTAKTEASDLYEAAEASTEVIASEHKWSREFKSNKNGHWRVCTDCGLEGEKASHISSGPAAVGKAETCTVCGYKKSGGGSTGGSTGGSGGTSVPKNPAVNGKEMSWNSIAKELSKLNEGEKTIIELNGNTKVPKDVVKAIAESKSVVKINVNSTFSWTIDGSKLKESDIKDIDFEVKVVTATGTEIIRGTIGTGFKIDNITDKATLNISFKAAHAGKFANLYKKVDGKLVFVDNVKIDENGNANGKNPLVSDVNGDGFINAKDALIILKKAAGLL